MSLANLKITSMVCSFAVKPTSNNNVFTGTGNVLDHRLDSC